MEVRRDFIYTNIVSTSVAFKKIEGRRDLSGVRVVRGGGAVEILL